MWLIAFLLSLVLASGTAAAFDCVGVTFPPTLVLCSDPELMRLADDRQVAINEARARIGEQEWPALWEDQKRWVRSYATACRVPPDRPPPDPVPASVIECFKRAGEARVAYLRAYGLSAGSIATSPGPALPPKELQASDMDEAPLEQKGGIFVIPVLINSAITLPFIIDSGAADVQIPVDVFSTLVRANTIVQTDLIGKRKYVLADGSTQDEPRFIIRELKVGNHTLRNVEASVGPVAGELLLGQTFLSQFSEWTLDNQRHVLRLVVRNTETPNETVPAINGRSQPGPVAKTVAVPAAPQYYGSTTPPSLIPGQPPKSRAFEEGLDDRRVWENWFGSLSGPFKDGAEYWSGQRSISKSGSCYGPGGQNLGDWTMGCLAAKRVLTPSDIRRKSEPEYRAGWNTF